MVPRAQRESGCSPQWLSETTKLWYQWFLLSSPPSYFASWVFVAFIVFQLQKHQKKLLRFLVVLCMRFFTCSRSCFENKLLVLFHRRPHGALASSVVTVEPSRNGRKQEVGLNSCCFQLSSSRALQFSFTLSALFFAASALVIVLGHAHLQRTRWFQFSSHKRTSRPLCCCCSTGNGETRAVGQFELMLFLFFFQNLLICLIHLKKWLFLYVYKSYIYTGRNNHRRQKKVTAQTLKILIWSVKLLLWILNVFFFMMLWQVFTVFLFLFFPKTWSYFPEFLQFLSK